MGTTKTKIHWLAMALVGQPEERERATRTVRDALDTTGGSARRSAAYLDYPWPGFLRLVDALGLLEYMRKARGRAAMAAKLAREQAKGRSRGRVPHWLTRVHREGSPEEKAKAEDAIKDAIRRSLGDVRAAAPTLGVSQATLYRLLDDYDLTWFAMSARAEAIRTKKTE